MIPVKVEGSPFSLIVGMLVDCVFIVIQILARIAPGKGSAVWKSTGYFVQENGGSGLPMP
jgi:hypothetical protein